MPGKRRLVARGAIPTLLIAVSYLLLSLWSRRLLFPGGLLSAAWLPNGLTLAALMVAGRRAWPGIIIGILVSAIVLSWKLLPPGVGELKLIFGLSFTDLIEPFLAVWIYRRTAHDRHPLKDYSGFLWFLGAMTLSCFIGTLPLTLLIDYLHLRGNLGPIQTILMLWLSGFLGMLLIAPLIIAHWPRPRLSSLMRRPLEWMAWLGGLIFIATLARYSQFEAIYLMLPLMAWAATRFSLSGSMLAIGLAALVTIAEILIHGAELQLSVNDILLEETLVLVMVGTSCYIRSLLEDRRQVATSLEHTVEERTRELQLMNFELRDEIFVRQQAEKSFRRSSRHYRALVETASNPIIVVDDQCVIRQWNGAAESLFGYSRDDARGLNLIDAFTPKPHQDEMAWKITKVLTSGVLKESIETEAYGFDGSRHIMLWNINRLHGEEEDESPQIILIGQDITEIRETQDKLHYLAHYDALTGTANRRLFDDRCRQAIEGALRYGHQTALISLDVDHFKRINDTLGHDAGDELLKEIAQRLRDSVRREDTIARLGGDEFAVLLNKVTGIEGCERAARNILDAITQPVRIPSGELVITSSIGITLAPEDGTEYEELLKNADMAMYRAKKAGRNNIQFFSREMNDEMQRQMTLEQELRHAIQNNELDLYYQPVVDLQTGDVVAMEALLRWRHPEKGLLSPEQFLNTAEQTGLLLQLGEWVCYNACLQARAIQTMSHQPIQVSINISPRQYNHPQLAQVLEKVIQETNVIPHLLCIEIDEHLLTERPEESLAILLRLRELGIQLVLDRFGSGLSSLRLLREFPFNQVKIDRELLQGLPEDANTAAIVHTLINLGRQLSLTVAAAGVESQEQERFLRTAGCHLAQGHRFCEAIPSNELGDIFHRIRGGKRLLHGNQFNLPLVDNR